MKPTPEKGVGFFWLKMETRRLRLENYTEAEKPKLIALLTDAAVMRHVDRGVLTTAEAEKLWTKLTEEFYPSGRRTIWAVFEKTAAVYVGHAAIRPRPEKPDDWEISYMLTTTAWGRGYATEIAERLVAYGFDTLGLREVFATVDDDNAASINVCRKAGMNFLRYEYDEQGRFSIYSVRKPA